MTIEQLRNQIEAIGDLYDLVDKLDQKILLQLLDDRDQLRAAMSRAASKRRPDHPIAIILRTAIDESDRLWTNEFSAGSSL